MPKETSQLEKLELAHRWENVRLSFFRLENNKVKVEELTAKVKFIEKELDAEYYH